MKKQYVWVVDYWSFDDNFVSDVYSSQEKALASVEKTIKKLKKDNDECAYVRNDDKRKGIITFFGIDWTDEKNPNPTFKDIDSDEGFDAFETWTIVKREVK